MKFTIAEWERIKIYLKTALDETESGVEALEQELKNAPSYLKAQDYLCFKNEAAELENFISRIESALI